MGSVPANLGLLDSTVNVATKLIGISGLQDVKIVSADQMEVLITQPDVMQPLATVSANKMLKVKEMLEFLYCQNSSEKVHSVITCN